MTVSSPYLTLRETQTYLNLGSPAAVYRLIREHGLPFCRIGGRYRFDVRELDAFAHGHDSALTQTRALREAKRRA